MMCSYSSSLSEYSSRMRVLLVPQLDVWIALVLDAEYAGSMVKLMSSLLAFVDGVVIGSELSLGPVVDDDVVAVDVV